VSYQKERGKDRKEEQIYLVDFISVKGEKAQGNKLSSKKVQSLQLIEEKLEKDTYIEDKVAHSTPIEDFEENEEDLKKTTDSKIIIDEDSTNNQFKLEL